MSRIKEKERAIRLRLKGLSYSQIKDELGISKSTLSGWLSSYPLSKKSMSMLRDNSEKRIENFRKTMKNKRDERMNRVLEKVSFDIGKMSIRDCFIAGLFLYWGEGSKTKKYSTSLTNTNPNMIKFFMEWLINFGVKKEKMKVNLHLYSDMNKDVKICFWSKFLGLKKSQFRKPYVKKTCFANISYKSGFGYGTCSLVVENRDLSEYILSAIKYIESMQFLCTH